MSEIPMHPPAPKKRRGSTPQPVLRPPDSDRSRSRPPGADPSRRGRGLGPSHLLGFALLIAIAIYLGINSLNPTTDNSTNSPASQGSNDNRTSVNQTETEPPGNQTELPPDSPPTTSLTEEPLVNDNLQEPVVHVAEFVTPSVVRISTDSGQGSGIVWNAVEGYIITNHHVIRNPLGGDPSKVDVTFSDGTNLEGEVVGSSANQDVSVIRVDPKAVSLKAAEFASMKSVRVGQLAVAIGSPFDLTGTVTAGIVSSIRINLYGGSDPNAPVPVEMIQTDAPINPGNSGGALADLHGRVIGMNTSIQTTLTLGNVGVGFAVPSDTVTLIAQRIVNNESLDIGFLGISSEGTPETGGVLVTSVVEGSPAATADIKVGDVITTLDGKHVDTIAKLSADIKLYRPGETVELKIQRGSSELTKTVELGSYTSSGAPR